MIAFRTDASLQIGTGHVMRCLTLANALATHGHECLFICRAHQGHQIEQIRDKGHLVNVLPALNRTATAPLSDTSATPHPVHSHWLGTSQAEDAQACVLSLKGLRPDWLIVDHYALDARWETALKACCGKLMTIDDLADRKHVCDLLLDQTFGRPPTDYRPLVPAECQILCGAQYALLRPEFAKLRSYSLKRRLHPSLRRILISMGGVDKDNATGQSLLALRNCPLPENCQIQVVMGSAAPWLGEVQAQAEKMPWTTTVQTDVNNMAQLMADSDIAIGAAGATTWERCCLGLPTIMLVLAQNQERIAQSLSSAGAAWTIERIAHISEQLPGMITKLSADQTQLKALARSASRIVEGHGVETVTRLMRA